MSETAERVALTIRKEVDAEQANREKKRPRHASLRRTVSTAYYALFHLPISEAALNWKRADRRPLLATFFEHGKMKAASDKQRGECNRIHQLNSSAGSNSGPQPTTITQWNRTEGLTLISQVDSAFESWRAIRDEPTAQAYLISLLGNQKGG